MNQGVLRLDFSGLPDVLNYLNNFLKAFNTKAVEGFLLHPPYLF